MTLVSFEIGKDTAEGVALNAGTIVATPTRRRVDGTVVVARNSVCTEFCGEAVTLELPSTPLGVAMKIIVDSNHAEPIDGYFKIPNVESISFSELIEVDPETLEAGEPEPEWWAVANATVNSGKVVGDHLILTRNDGVEVDAGNVRGLPGQDGKDGEDGKDGRNGLNGFNGKDGVSVVNTEIDANGDLLVTLSNDQVLNAGHARGLDDAGVSNLIQTPASETASALSTATVQLGDGRYRRVLSELRDVASGADARAVIQDAISQASGSGYSELVLPEGDWNLTSAVDGPIVNASALKVTASNVTLKGAGEGKTRLYSQIGRNLIGVIGTADARLSNVIVMDLTLEGDSLASSQKGISADFVDGLTVERVRVKNMGNNGLNIFNCDGAIINNIEVSGGRDFGVLFYRSTNSKIIDAYVHDIGMGRAHLGIQFKSSQYCEAIRPRIERIQGYGFYTWDDGIDSANFPDKGHSLVDPLIRDTLSGGTFNPQSVYINVTNGMYIRGGRYVESASGLISCRESPNLTIDSIPELSGAHGAPALSINGGSFRVSGVNANGRGVSNELGLVIAGSPLFGSVRNSNFINGGAGAGVSDNAAARLESTVTGVFMDNNDFSDYQAVKTQRRGMYDRTVAGVNYWRNNKALGNTTINKFIPVGSIDSNNITT